MQEQLCSPRMCSVLEFLGMERDGSIPRTRFCVRLRRPDRTNSSHRREYSAQMRDGVIRPNRWDGAEPRRKKSPLTFSPKPYRCLPLFFSRSSPPIDQRRLALPSLSPSPVPLPPVQIGRRGRRLLVEAWHGRLRRGSAGLAGGGSFGGARWWRLVRRGRRGR
jgi:hypothetical protein